MNKVDLTTLMQFNFWANGCILATCEQLTPEQFTQPLNPDPGWGSLRGILVHLLDTEYGWRSVLQNQDSPVLDEAGFPDIQSLKNQWQTEKEAWLNYLNNLTDEMIEQSDKESAPDSMTIQQTITHVATHGIQHRSEAAFILTSYGHSPGELDYDIFVKLSTDNTES